MPIEVADGKLDDDTSGSNESCTRTSATGSGSDVVSSSVSADSLKNIGWDGGSASASLKLRRIYFQGRTCLISSPATTKESQEESTKFIPVIVSDELKLPFEGILDYRKL
ncbi:hypothetical protein L2E82_52214 [Cichorium intybus]|nr:hypothetical protein L2E82_52214 [Cichorium intybus]